MSRRVVVALCVVALLVAGAGVAVQSLRGSTESIEEAGSRFDPPSGWELVDETLTPDTAFCMGSTPCPYLNRRYRGPSVLDTAAFRDLLQGIGDGSSVEVAGECTQPTQVSGAVGLCTGVAVADGHRYTLDQSAQVDSPGGTPTAVFLTLLVEEE